LQALILLLPCRTLLLLYFYLYRNVEISNNKRTGAGGSNANNGVMSSD